MDLYKDAIKDRLVAEKELEQLMEAEEIYWQQRGGGGGEWWWKVTLTPPFFHLLANGRRRKKHILSLEHEGTNVTDPAKIRDMIYSYYKNRFGKSQ